MLNLGYRWRVGDWTTATAVTGVAAATPAGVCNGRTTTGSMQTNRCPVT